MTTNIDVATAQLQAARNFVDIAPAELAEAADKTAKWIEEMVSKDRVYRAAAAFLFAGIEIPEDFL